MSSLRLACMTEADIPEVRALEQQAFTTTWQENAFLTELRQNPAAHYLVLRTAEGQLAGYAGLWMVEDEAHVTSVAISTELQGQGLGRRLMLGLVLKSLTLGARWATLEVRCDNEPAQALYRRFGFVKIGNRPKYYQGGQDAHILWAGNLGSRPYQERLRELARPWPEVEEELLAYRV